MIKYLIVTRSGRVIHNSDTKEACDKAVDKLRYEVDEGFFVTEIIQEYGMRKTSERIR